jgi:hypothetical protein
MFLKSFLSSQACFYVFCITFAVELSVKVPGGAPCADGMKRESGENPGQYPLL